MFDLRQLFQGLCTFLTHPKYFWIVAAIVVVADGTLTELIVRLIPYTEIDWETYMIQVETINQGEYNYAKVSGPTGPLVYPAGHVRIHSLLHTLTQGGKDISSAQQIYATLYTASLAVVCGIYRKSGVPNWLLLFLPLSKRLHSIYVLRLFNDCWSVFAAQAAVLAFQSGMDDLGTLLLSAAVSVKMSAILYLPGLLVILYKRRGLVSTLRHFATVIAFQAVIAHDFLQADPAAYLRGAFDLSRVFLFKWTVNWRILGEDLFLDPRWAIGLLIGHASVLTTFGLQWCYADGGAWATIRRGLLHPSSPAGLVPVTSDYVATVLFTSNLIGILFARSLHYQFYSWYAQQLPFLTYKSRYPLPIKIMILLAVEYSWNVFPSTDISSTVLLAAHVILVVGLWRI